VRQTNHPTAEIRDPDPGSDLKRIRGIGVDYAGMLLAVGIRSVQELSQQDPMTLSDSLLEVNLLRDMVKSVPSERRVAGWIRQAQGMRG